MHLQHAELALDEMDARLDVGHRLEREVDDVLDRQAGVTSTISARSPSIARVAAGAQRRAEVGRELPAQVGDQSRP